MRQRNFIFVVLAVFLTVGTIYIARSWLAAQHVQAVQEPARPAQQGVSVLVAAHDLATGSFVRPEDLRWQAWPEGQIADNYLLKDKDAPESLSGAVIKLRIAAGEPVTSNRVIKPGDRGFLAAVLSPGMRAVSVPVTPISDISGLVFPGDHVDLILSHQVKIISQKQGDASGGTSDSSAFVSETIQTDLRILAIDQSMGDVEGKPMLGRTVTFEVTPQQVEAIEVSSMVGTLYLSLRGLAGSDTMAGDGVAGEELTPHGVRSVSHTWDSDVSPFITREGGAMNVVTILRGETKAGGGGSTSVNAAPSAAPAATPPNPGGPAAPNQGGSAPARTTSGP
jgi:pilus assembly protein CpaB